MGFHKQNYNSGTIKHLAALSQCSISRENLFKQRVPTALARLFDTFEEFYRQRNARATFKQTFPKRGRLSSNQKLKFKDDDEEAKGFCGGSMYN